MYSTRDFAELRRLGSSVLAARDTHPSPLAHAMSRLWNLITISEIGAFDEFWPARDEVRAEFTATGALIGSSIAGYYIERATRYAGRPIDERAIADVEAATSPFNQALAKVLRAERRLDAGDVEGAMALASGIEQSGFAYPMSHARVVLGRVALAEARAADALAHADAGIAMRVAIPSIWAELQLVRIDALEALGERERRSVAIDEVRARLESMLENTTTADRAHVLALPPFARVAALSGARI